MRRMFSQKQIEELAQAQAKLVKKDIATLVDADGHDRFIEGESSEITIEGVTFNYNKWSLSGTHLMCVMCATLAQSTALTDNVVFSKFAVPQWVYDKIITLWGNRVDRATFNFYGTLDGSVQQSAFNLVKQTNEVQISISTSGITMDKERIIRVSFDLLIDSE